MAEYTNVAVTEVSAGQNVPLTETAVSGGCCILHREGAGIATLRGATSQCRALYKVGFGANIAVPSTGTVGAISAALAINGEPLASATAIVTPAAVSEYNNIYLSAIVSVPRGCCVTVAAENVSTQAVDFANSNMVIERIA